MILIYHSIQKLYSYFQWQLLIGCSYIVYLLLKWVHVSVAIVQGLKNFELINIILQDLERFEIINNKFWYKYVFNKITNV